MSLSRKHFESLAKIIKQTKQEFTEYGYGDETKVLINLMESRIADFCANENPHFNITTFTEACKE